MRRYAKHDIPRPFRAAAHHSRGAWRRVTTRDSEDRNGMKFLKYETLLGRGLYYHKVIENKIRTENNEIIHMGVFPRRRAALRATRAAGWRGVD